MYKKRLLRVTFTFDNDFVTYDESFTIRVTTDKHILSTYNRATVEITNMSKDKRSALMTDFNQFKERKQQTPFVGVKIEIGREGQNQLQQVYKGYVLSCEMSSPPDIVMRIQCGTDLVDKTNWLQSVPPSPIKYKALCQWCADSMGKTLDIDGLSIDSNVNNFYPQATVAALPVLLQQLFPDKVAAFVDDDILVVKDIYSIASTPAPIELDRTNGLIGTPAWNQFGITGKALADVPLRLGKGVAVKSTVNPTISGSPMVITKLSYELVSRDNSGGANPWYVNFTASPAAS